MVIKISAAAEIRQLVEALGSGDPVRREGAVARLAIAGARAVDRLVAAYHAAADPDTRIAVLRTLEAIADPRAAAVGRAAVLRGGDEAVAGAATLRALLDSPHAAAAAQSLDTLVAVALDPAAGRRLRLAAVDALQDLPEAIRAQIEPALRAHRAPEPSEAASVLWEDALEGRLPDDPAAFREVLRQRAADAPVTTLARLVELVRAREATARSGTTREGWRGARGALHQALALRGSRVAVYDLRETLEDTRGALPVSFLAALHAVGDASCLPALAARFDEAAPDDPWRAQVREAFRAIAKRERITRRHAVMKRIAARWPSIVSTL